MRKRTYRKPVLGLSPVHKAQIRQAWQADCDKASIHAFIGDDPQALVCQAGAILYTVVSACEDAGIASDDADVAIVHEAAKALVELASRTSIDEALREPIANGLAACTRLQPRLDPALLQRTTLDRIQADLKGEHTPT